MKTYYQIKRLAEYLKIGFYFPKQKTHFESVYLLGVKYPFLVIVYCKILLFQFKASSKIYWKETPEVHNSCKTTGTSTGVYVSDNYWRSGSDLQIKFWCGAGDSGSTTQLTISEGKIRWAKIL